MLHDGSRGCHNRGGVLLGLQGLLRWLLVLARGLLLLLRRGNIRLMRGLLVLRLLKGCRPLLQLWRRQDRHAGPSSWLSLPPKLHRAWVIVLGRIQPACHASARGREQPHVTHKARPSELYS